MLKRLYIRNYALIEEQELEFSDHLTIITGETGAGKSILLGALGLVMGERADTKVFYNEGEKCIVEATFEVSAYDLEGFFQENELDFDQTVIVRREFSPSGKSRAFINDTPANNLILKRLTENLIDLHQQFDTLDIHNVNFQLRMIDALADNKELLKAYQAEYKTYLKVQKQLEELTRHRDSGAREQEFIQFQLDELLKAELIPEEQAALEDELSRLSNAEEIKKVYGEAYGHLQESEQSIISQLQEISRNWAQIKNTSSSLQALSERLDTTIVELQELSKDCERISEDTDLDPSRLHEVQERIDLLYRLQKKHNVGDVKALIALQEELSEKVGSFANLDGAIAEAEQQIANLKTSLSRQADVLSERRKGVTASFEEQVQEMLRPLAMPHAQIRVDIRLNEKLGPTGKDEVQFLFATNVGSKFLPIKDVASGGELSRLTLCAKSLVADAIPLPTLIFDEIDTGVSGNVSLQMGHLLRQLSARHQVISITHTPQVAARAHRHYYVYKKVEDNRTITKVSVLTDEQRMQAIAVMLSGNPPSDAALHTARELMAV